MGGGTVPERTLLREGRGRPLSSSSLSIMTMMEQPRMLQSSQRKLGVVIPKGRTHSLAMRFQQGGCQEDDKRSSPRRRPPPPPPRSSVSLIPPPPSSSRSSTPSSPSRSPSLSLTGSLRPTSILRRIGSLQRASDLTTGTTIPASPLSRRRRLDEREDAKDKDDDDDPMKKGKAKTTKKTKEKKRAASSFATGLSSKTETTTTNSEPLQRKLSIRRKGSKGIDTVGNNINNDNNNNNNSSRASNITSKSGTETKKDGSRRIKMLDQNLSGSSIESKPDMDKTKDRSQRKLLVVRTKSSRTTDSGDGSTGGDGGSSTTKRETLEKKKEDRSQRKLVVQGKGVVNENGNATSKSTSTTIATSKHDCKSDRVPINKIKKKKKKKNEEEEESVVSSSDSTNPGVGDGKHLSWKSAFATKSPLPTSGGDSHQQQQQQQAANPATSSTSSSVACSSSIWDRLAQEKQRQQSLRGRRLTDPKLSSTSSSTSSSSTSNGASPSSVLLSQADRKKAAKSFRKSLVQKRKDANENDASAIEKDACTKKSTSNKKACSTKDASAKKGASAKQRQQPIAPRTKKTPPLSKSPKRTNSIIKCHRNSNVPKSPKRADSLILNADCESQIRRQMELSMRRRHVVSTIRSIVDSGSSYSSETSSTDELSASSFANSSSHLDDKDNAADAPPSSIPILSRRKKRYGTKGEDREYTEKGDDDTHGSGRSLGSITSLNSLISKPVSILRRNESSKSIGGGESICGSMLGRSSNHSARFSLASSQVIEVPKLPVEDLPDLFYDDDELAQMRHEAFCESLGINPSDFD